MKQEEIRTINARAASRTTQKPEHHVASGITSAAQKSKDIQQQPSKWAVLAIKGLLYEVKLHETENNVASYRGEA